MSTLKELLACPSSIMVPGIYDALTARIVENKGFKAGWISGFSVNASLGLPDANVLQIDDFVSRLKEIRRGTSLFLIADCDEGFGTIENTLILMEQLCSIGIDAICIEDNRFPKINSFKQVSERKLESTDQFSLKIRTIKNKYPSLTVIARTEALIGGLTLDEAIERANQYAEAGADVILIHSRYQEYHEFENIINKWNRNIPLAVVPTKAQNVTFDEFDKLGYKLVIYANQLLRNSVHAMEETLNKLLNNCTIHELVEQAVSMEYIFELTEKNFDALTLSRYSKK